MNSRILELNPKEKELLITELEKYVIPELRGDIASGMRKDLREELKGEEGTLKGIIEKLKKAA